MNWSRPLPAASLLECPGCGAALTGGPSTGAALFDATYFGIVRCDCSEYPVIAGVPIIMKGRLHDSDGDVARLCALLHAGRHEEALLEALLPKLGVAESPRLHRVLPQSVTSRIRAARVRSERSHWIARFRELSEDRSPGSVIRLILHYFGARRRQAAHYFAFRAGQPKYLVTLALSRGRPNRSLDIGCGAGHITRALRGAGPSAQATGVDANFFLLWLANTRVAPDASFVCCDVEKGLPFHDDVFQFLLLSNFYHFLYEKRFMLMETKRVGSADSVVVISSLRNANVKTATPNAALDPIGYRRLCSARFDNAHMVGESELLQHVLDARAELPTSPRTDELNDEAMINLLLCDGQELDPALSAELGRCAVELRINPLYRRGASGAGPVLTLERRWPSSEYVEDNPEMPAYLPEQVALPMSVVAALAERRYVAEMEPLLRTGVLVDLPEHY